MSESLLCLLCHSTVTKNDGNILTAKGLLSLSEVSRQRQDGKWQHMNYNGKNMVHVSCRRNYTRASSIKAAQNNFNKNSSGKHKEGLQWEDFRGLL